MHTETSHRHLHCMPGLSVPSADMHRKQDYTIHKANCGLKVVLSCYKVKLQNLFFNTCKQTVKGGNNLEEETLSHTHSVLNDTLLLAFLHKTSSERVKSV